MENSVSGNRDKVVPKKTYAKPELIEYGSIAKLTQGVIGSGTDGTSGMSRRMMS